MKLLLDTYILIWCVEIPHRDPADRLLAATARYYELRLATADERLLAGTGFSTVAN